MKKKPNNFNFYLHGTTRKENRQNKKNQLNAIEELCYYKG